MYRKALSHFVSHFRLGDFTPLILGLVPFLHHGKGEGKDQQDEQNAQRQENGWAGTTQRRTGRGA
jgi:hypothetical protein